MIQLSDAEYYAIYFVILIISYVLVYYSSKSPSKKQRISSLVLANGVSSFVSLVFLSAIFPQFGWIAPVQVDPAVLISLVIAVWDGLTYRDRKATEVPAPQTATNKRSASKSANNTQGSHSAPKRKRGADS